MNHHRCFSTLGCPEFGLAEVRDLAWRHAVPQVELRALGGTVDLPGYFAANFNTPPDAAAAAGELGLKVAALGGSLRLIDGAPKDREQLLAWVPWAEALGARWLRVFDGGETGEADEIAYAAETLAWWRDARARGGWRVDLMMETHDSLFTAAAIRRLTAAVPGVAILWDAHHTWKKGGEDPLATWAAVREHVVHVHVKDSRSAPEARDGFVYVEPGRGEFPFAALVARLRADGFGGAVSLEWEKLWHPQLGPLEGALAAAAAQGW